MGSGVVRKYALIEDLDRVQVGGAEDGSKYVGQKAYNVTPIVGANLDGTDGYVADGGVKDTDLYNITVVGNWYVVNLSGASDNADTKITFASQVNLVTLDNTRSSTPLYYELNDTAASSSSVAVPALSLAVLPAKTTIIHIYTANHTLVQVRGQ